jgi:hypothetical protein
VALQYELQMTAMIIQVKVKVKPGDPLQFPGICAHCSQTAAYWMPVKRWSGRLTRRIDVPVCKDCARLLSRRSWQEERWAKVGWIIAVGAAVLVLLLAFFLLFAPLPFAIRLTLALLAAGLAGYDAWAFARRRGLSATLPEKKTVLAAARITDFSWWSTTFEFGNDHFAERFVELNRTLLI